jgi:hypothetical protein
VSSEEYFIPAALATTVDVAFIIYKLLRIQNTVTREELNRLIQQEEYILGKYEIVSLNNIVHNIVSTPLEYIRNTEDRKDKKERSF